MRVTKLHRALGAALVPLVGAVAPLVSVSPVAAHTATCVEFVNPHGANIPPAGSTTLPGPRGGQNDDGFYRVTVSDTGDQLYLYDLGTRTVIDVFGPFSAGGGLNIKYTQAPGATPSVQKIGSANGQAGAVDYHVKGAGDLGVLAVGSGESADIARATVCFVPPPPK